MGTHILLAWPNIVVSLMHLQPCMAQMAVWTLVQMGVHPLLWIPCYPTLSDFEEVVTQPDIVDSQGTIM